MLFCFYIKMVDYFKKSLDLRAYKQYFKLNLLLLRERALLYAALRAHFDLLLADRG